MIETVVMAVRGENDGVGKVAEVGLSASANTAYLKTCVLEKTPVDDPALTTIDVIVFTVCGLKRFIIFIFTIVLPALNIRILLGFCIVD